jgi:hypothetical protein
MNYVSVLTIHQKADILWREGYLSHPSQKGDHALVAQRWSLRQTVAQKTAKQVADSPAPVQRSARTHIDHDLVLLHVRRVLGLD